MNKKKVLLSVVVASVFVFGGIVGYAASTKWSFAQNINQIYENFSKSLRYGKEKAQAVDELTEQLKAESQIKNGLQEEIASLRKQIQEKIDEGNKKVAVKQAELDQKQLELDNRVAQLGLEKQQALDSLRAEYEKKISMISSQNETVIRQLQDSLSSKENALLELNGKISSMSSEIETLNNSKEDLERTVESLRVYTDEELAKQNK
ncbi:hypothetical protein [Enterococcus sp. DIV1059_2]|uniref:hypothetical protein n=1 Tax=Enterococcus sp. DIV1059_2 TaxID=2774664 RepID=UPI003F27E56E